MDRRTYLKAMAVAGASAGMADAAQNPVRLYVDLEVNPAKEQEMLKTYRDVFRPAISKQPGFVQVELMKLRNEVAGKAPQNMPYRLLISFQTEEQRQNWVASDLHQQVWPRMEASLQGSKYIVLLYDPV